MNRSVYGKAIKEIWDKKDKKDAFKLINNSFYEKEN